MTSSDQAMGWVIRGSNPGRAKRLRPDLEPPSMLFNGYRRSLQWVKRSGREVDHSHQPSADAENEWSYISTPPTYLHFIYRNNFIFKFYFSVNAVVHHSVRESGCLSQRHGTFSGCGQRRRPPDVGSYEYGESAIAQSRQGTKLQLGDWAQG